MGWLYHYAEKHRPATEIAIVTHQNGTITNLAFQTGTNNSAHEKGNPNNPPNSTSYFEFSIDNNDNCTLIDSGQTIAR